MKNPIKLISLAVLSTLLFACDNVPTTEEMLADPKLRKEIKAKCKVHGNARWDEAHEHHSLCSNLVSAASACMMGNELCKK
ncbi:MAG: hypothetical protein O2970_11130 [Proteobacteria bacterium]|nr:hypothetical protein [Pseudomonadota bacterium]